MALTTRQSLVLLLFLGWGCSGGGSGSGERFRNATEALGVDFHHQDGATGSYYVPEIMGGGVALLDYDNDQDLDLFFVQGGRFEAGGETWEDALFRNDLVDDPTTLAFSSVGSEALPSPSGYGMGVATGDFDGDGWADLYVTRFGSNQLLRNNQDGTFADVTERAGVDDPRWGIAATFFDYDRDGLSDLFVGNFLNFQVEAHIPCMAPAGWPDYCGPLAYTSVPDRLFHNLGGGRFEDVSMASGIGRIATNTLGATARDFDGDSWPDLYIANDSQPNTLWINNRDGTFSDRALVGGCAVNQEGNPEASMGVAIGDYDSDGDHDVFLAHLTGESNTLYQMDGGGFCKDATSTSGLATPSLQLTAFGTGFLDVDLDGWLDIALANGAISVVSDQLQAGVRIPLAQPNQLFLSDRGQSFTEAGLVSQEFKRAKVSRGLAVGDLDNDGRADLVVTNIGDGPDILLNQSRHHHWIGFDLKNRDGSIAIGSTILVVQNGRRKLATVATDGSYGSAKDGRILIGVGEATAPLSIEVLWADGTQGHWADLEIDRYHRLAQPASSVAATVPRNSEG